jgi:hypothetical protein
VDQKPENLPSKIVEEKAPPPPSAEPVEENAIPREFKSNSPNMTDVLVEKGIPDRVVNEGKLTIWVYEGDEGGEFFAFRKGEFFGFKHVPKEDSLTSGTQEKPQ